ncbi:MAG TPA: hypothetical protein VNX65_01320 [Patescibacteria group bacterium]|jgi:hypothetical protein|nr:hypothetical protein [Patescibacteria group bacterium]
MSNNEITDGASAITDIIGMEDYDSLDPNFSDAENRSEVIGSVVLAKVVSWEGFPCKFPGSGDCVDLSCLEWGQCQWNSNEG